MFKTIAWLLASVSFNKLQDRCLATPNDCSRTDDNVEASECKNCEWILEQTLELVTPSDDPQTSEEVMALRLASLPQTSDNIEA